MSSLGDGIALDGDEVTGAGYQSVQILALHPGVHRGGFPHRGGNCRRALTIAPGVMQEHGAHKVGKGEDGNQDQGGMSTVHGIAIVFAQLQNDGPALFRGDSQHMGCQRTDYICANGMPAARSSA